MEALKAMKNVLQKTYFKNVLKDGFIDTLITTKTQTNK